MRWQVMALVGLVAALSGCDRMPSELEAAGTEARTTSAADAAVQGTQQDPGAPAAAARVARLMLPPLDGSRPECPEAAGECRALARRALEGLDVERTVTFLDASGAVQEAYDPATTASVHFLMAAEGEVGRNDRTRSIERNRDLTATELLDDDGAALWNGVEESETERDSRQAEARIHSATRRELTDVLVPYPRQPEAWPLSGTVTQTTKVTIEGGPRDGAVREWTASVTFNGTHLVPLTVNGETRTLDLSERPGERRPRGHGPHGPQSGGGPHGQGHGPHGPGPGGPQG